MDIEKTTKVVGINGKEKNIIQMKKVTQDEHEFVEVFIKGKTGRVWREWWPYNQFKKDNPNIEV